MKFERRGKFSAVFSFKFDFMPFFGGIFSKTCINLTPKSLPPNLPFCLA
ncbi:hypothetical protein [uncultured Campylobacter sp.]|nr:hypothetical protein [uncultured Campylobacter sp.]